MKWVVRTVVFGLLAALTFLIIQLTKYEKHYAALTDQIISVAASSFFSGCMVDRTADLERALLCKDRTFEFVNGLTQAIGENQRGR